MREATPIEFQKIKKYFKKTFSINISDEINKYSIFVFSSRIYLLDKQNKMFERFLTKTSRLTTFLLSFGLYFGDLAPDGSIKPTLEGFCIFAKLIKKSYLVLNDAGEQMFLYGKSILYEGVDHFKPPIKKYKLIYIFNKNHECLGIAKSVVNDDFLGKNKELHALVARPLYDRGLYIRSSGFLFKL